MSGNTQKILKNKKFVMVDPVEYFDFKITSVYVIVSVGDCVKFLFRKLRQPGMKTIANRIFTLQKVCNRDKTKLKHSGFSFK